MKGIIYVSTTENRDANTMRNLCNEFSLDNRRHDVTGLLIFSSGTVIQYIEGEAKVIDQLYLNIQKDLRHYNVITIFEESIDTRIFNEWGMKFHHSQFVDLKEHFKSNQINILKSFVKSNFTSIV
jgi:hypothetical protein